MLNRPLLIARTEIVDHLRDTRSLASAVLYTFMGPLIVGMVLLARSDGATNPAAHRILPIMASVFAMMAAFTSGMSLAMDTVAGERERRSLLPLLLSSASRAELVVGKWLATFVFAAAGVIANAIAFGGILVAARLPFGLPSATSVVLLMSALLALAALVAALEVLASTMCRSLKEAQTWLSILVFLAMAGGMWLAFQPQSLQGWGAVLPVAGHQRLLHDVLAGGAASIAEVAVLILASGVLTALLLAHTGRLFRRDEIIYGH
jgi:sodium transport system permease protein